MAVEELAFSWAVPVCLLLLTVVLFYLYGSWTMSTWKQQGVPGPQPLAFLGNVKDIQKKGLNDILVEWSRTYGKMYGIYMFRTPFLMTTDVDILKEVFVKDFNNFISRGNPQPFESNITRRSVLLTSGDTWRRLRHTLTPSFSAAKLKQMNPFVKRCCDNLVKVVSQTAVSGTPLDVKRTFGSFTLDVIAGTGFGFETNSLEEEDNIFLSSVRAIFSRNARPQGLLVLLASVFPALEPLLRLFVLKNGAPRSKDSAFVADTIRTVIQERKASTSNVKGRVDLLQLMLDAEATEEELKANPDVKRLSAEEISSQGLIFFVAGYETTATTLQYLSYLLALNPDKQETLYQHIVAAVGDADPTYENVSNISYLDNCIHEALRCFPPVPMFGRKAAETRVIKGVTIPAGCSIMASVYGMMRDEEYFPEPSKFLPERFEGESGEKIPSLVKDLVFGAGPRQCIGMRLALYEAKMAMVAVLRKVKFVKIPETPETITFLSARLSSPKQKIVVGTELRE